MDSKVYDALIDLRATIAEQRKAQEITNDLLRALIGTLQENAQAMTDLQQAIQAKKR